MRTFHEFMSLLRLRNKYGFRNNPEFRNKQEFKPAHFRFNLISIFVDDQIIFWNVFKI